MPARQGASLTPSRLLEPALTLPALTLPALTLWGGGLGGFCLGPGATT